MPIRYARCFAPGVSFRSHDFVLVRVDDARQMVADGMAETVNKGKDIRMFARTIIKLRDRSCSWSHRLMELVGEGNYTAMVMLEEIKPYLRVSTSIRVLNDYERPMDATDHELLPELRIGTVAA